jgi:hypothetical protein
MQHDSDSSCSMPESGAEPPAQGAPSQPQASEREPDQDEPSADAREPLSDERIVNLFQESFPRTKYSAAWKSFARAIEAEHGIGSKE